VEQEIEQNVYPEKPDWMKKGLFNIDPEEKPTTYTFEKEDNNDEEPKSTQEPKHKRDRKHKRHGPKPCIVITILAFALVASHLYQLRHLAKALTALQEMGAKPKSKECKKTKKNKDKKV